MGGYSRDWYLSALGVVRYIPRAAAVEGAEESAAETLGCDHSEAQAAAAPKVSSVNPIAFRHDESAPQTTMGQHQQPVAVATIPSPSLIASANDEESIHFRLGFWQPSPQLVVLSTMPPGIRPDAGQQQMLANLLKAIQQLPGNLAFAELIDWPLSPGTSSALSGARELLDAFLDVKAKLQPFTFALLMGSTTARLVAEDAANVGDRLPLRCQAQGIVTHSLHDMSANPDLKRETWEAIRFLAQSH